MLENKLYEIFKFYKQKVREDRTNNDFLYPIGLKFLPLYIHSFLKRGSLNYPQKGSNYIKNVYLLMKIMREPILNTIKFLYPKMYRIDNIENLQYKAIIEGDILSHSGIGDYNSEFNFYKKPILIRLSKDCIDMDKCYLIDDGNYISLLIFDKLNKDFYFNLFNLNSFEEIKINKILSLDEDNENNLNVKLFNIIYQLRNENNGFNQPVRLFLYNEKDIYDNNLLYLLIEDKIGFEPNYPDFLFKLNNLIQSNNF